MPSPVSQRAVSAASRFCNVCFGYAILCIRVRTTEQAESALTRAATIMQTQQVDVVSGGPVVLVSLENMNKRSHPYAEQTASGRSGSATPRASVQRRQVYLAYRLTV